MVRANVCSVALQAHNVSSWIGYLHIASVQIGFTITWLISVLTTLWKESATAPLLNEDWRPRGINEMEKNPLMVKLMLPQSCNGGLCLSDLPTRERGSRNG